jgi:hypothetical protein
MKKKRKKKVGKEKEHWELVLSPILLLPSSFFLSSSSFSFPFSSSVFISLFLSLSSFPLIFFFSSLKR